MVHLTLFASVRGLRSPKKYVVYHHLIIEPCLGNWVPKLFDVDPTPQGQL